MGAWGVGPFENDTACDWAYALEHSHDLSLIEASLERVLAEDDYLQAPVAEEGIAAADTVARLLGKATSRDSYTEAVDDWVSTHQQLEVVLVLPKAVQVLGRVTKPPSELLELWEESEALEDWLVSIQSLRDSLFT